MLDSGWSTRLRKLWKWIRTKSFELFSTSFLISFRTNVSAVNKSHLSCLFFSPKDFLLICSILGISLPTKEIQTFLSISCEALTYLEIKILLLILLFAFKTSFFAFLLRQVQKTVLHFGCKTFEWDTLRFWVIFLRKTAFKFNKLQFFKSQLYHFYFLSFFKLTIKLW